MINVVIVEDSAPIREGLKFLLNGTEGFKCSNTYENCEDMLKEIEEQYPDVMLMDIGLPGMSGIEGIEKVKKIFPDIPILILTVYEENEKIFDALCAGACGYLVKKTEPTRLLEAIKEASEGGAPMSAPIARKVVAYFQKKDNKKAASEVYSLTAREKEVLKGLVEGNSYQVIADSLFISIDTVRYHFRNIYRKLHVHSQKEAVAKAIKEGLV
ncbi:MAG: response regulator [Rhodothermaceae bacterium]